MDISLNSNYQAYIEKFTDFAASYGLSKSVAKVLGYLLICNPQRQTVQSIQESLKLSSGGTHAAVTLLANLGMIERIKLPRDKQYYYEIRPDSFKRAVVGRLTSAQESRQLAEDGLSIDKNNTRLLAMRDVFGLLERELVGIVAKLESES
jgi:DNA-binding transcriptional regulator GbsR (MarR family)